MTKSKDTKPAVSILDRLEAAGLSFYPTKQGGESADDGWPVLYAGTPLTDKIDEALDLEDAFWVLEEDKVALAANDEHVQSLTTCDDHRLVVVTLKNVVDGESFVHVFHYNTDQDYLRGVESQRVAPHARADNLQASIADGEVSPQVSEDPED